jgi:hypothetical protein
VADSSSMITYLSAASALFLSAVIITAIARQKTHRQFQKHVLLVAVYLLVSAIISNVLITILVGTFSPQSSVAVLKDSIILSKRLQATFDYLFGLTIGAFIFAATTREIGSTRDFFRYMKTEFPNSYVFYLFLMIMTIVTIWFSAPTVESTNPTIITFESYFLFVNGVAVATLILYAPYRFILYLREVKPDQEIRRDVFAIIIGISGFAVAELLFEIVLPTYYGTIDLRAPGFILEMGLIGLIAFGVRGKSFLQDLIIPEAEAHLLTRPTYSLDRGITYVVMERDATQAFDIFKDLVTHGAQGLCITRRAPKAVMTEYGLERTPVLWLSRVATEKNAVRPSPPENVAMSIEHFIEASERSVVLLDGFEYLVAHNDFGSVLALLHDLNENVAIRESILLVPFDPSAFNEREIALIRREVRLLGPMADEFGQVARVTR